MAKRSRSIDLTQVSEWQEGDLRRFQDYLVAEEPLEIRIAGAPLTVTMRTPGHDLELAAGFLFTEGLIQKREQIASLTEGTAEKQEASGNLVEVELAGTEFERERMQRNFFVASSCGICGKASIDAIRVRGIPAPNPGFRFDPDVLCTLPDKLRSAQTIFGRTGGLHAAGLFSSEGELIVVREDVGRHNAVDKIVGWALLEGRLPLSECALMVSGRGGFEIIQKALVAGLPLVASVSAPSGLAVRLARELGLTLVGFLRGRRFLIYSGEQRLASSRAPAAAEPR
ncbi:MAG TPA: formate dehydrogenase accessory sulfurtransferase FdhD [Terriglobales bacterium]|nr:formate dehydrogenase accessory sulfurtransferase FdhD [Terriglobales bacterium]